MRKSTSLGQVMVLLVLCACACACARGGGSGGSSGGAGGGNQPDGGGAGADAGIDAGLPPPGLVTGVRLRHFVQRSGITDVPVNGTVSPLQVFIWDGGSFGSVPVTATDGGFSFVTTVRPYWVGADGTWLVSSSDTLDWSFDVIGRPTDTVYDGGEPYDAQFDFLGLTPWVLYHDDVELMTEAVDSAWGGWFPNMTIDAGATAVTGQFSYLGGFDTLPRLVGDSVILTQRRNTTLYGGLSPDGGTISGFTSSLVAGSGPVTLTLPQPAGATTSATFSPLTQHSATITFDPSFDLVAASNPLATKTSCSVDVFAYVDLHRGTTGYLGSLGSMTLRGLSSQPQTLNWGNPSSAAAAWPEAALVGCQYSREVTLAGTTGSATIVSSASLSASPQTLFADVLRPPMSPPRDPQADGAAILGAPLTLAGTTPLISWTPPATGTPNVYFVTITEYSAAGGVTTELAQVGITTTATEVRVPPGVLASGGIYTVHITASNLSGGLFKADSAPLYESASSQAASVVSALLTVP